MKNKDNGMIDLSSKVDPDLSNNPQFIKTIPRVAWFWIVGGIIVITLLVLFLG